MRKLFILIFFIFFNFFNFGISVLNAGFYDGQPASLVIGQPDFTTMISTPVSQNSLTNAISDIKMDANGSLWTAERYRVMRFDPPFSNGMDASLVIGQPDFSTITPRGGPNGLGIGWGYMHIAFGPDNSLWLAGDKVFRFDPPFSNFMNASLVLGKADFYLTYSALAPVTASTASFSPGIDVDNDNNVWVTDIYNNRILKFLPPFSNGMNANMVIGQPDFISREPNITGGPVPKQNSLDSPAGLDMDKYGNLWVADEDNQRVLRFDPPFSDFMNASLVLGATDFTARNINYGVPNCAPITNQTIAPWDIFIDNEGNIWTNGIGDVKMYKPPFKTGMPPDLILFKKEYSCSALLYDHSGPVTQNHVTNQLGIFRDKDGNLWVGDYEFYLSPDECPYGCARVLMFQNLEEPMPPSNLQAIPIGENKINLTWNPSPSTSTAYYNIYYDSGTGKIDYFVVFASVPASVNSYTTPALTQGVTYKFGVRARHINNVVELNRNVIASAKAVSESINLLQAVIKIPPAGKRISGNRVTVMAEIQGSLNLLKDVRFQYRVYDSTTAAWTDIIPATINHPNPDKTFPYFIHWDVSGLSDGNYELRAQVTDIFGNIEENPAAILITIDHTSPEIEENAVGDSVQKKAIVYNTIEETLKTGAGDSNNTIAVKVPAGAITESTATVKIKTNPSSIPSAPESNEYAGVSAEILIENGQTELNKNAILTFEYQDADNDFYIDGTFLRADKCSIYAYDNAKSEWRKDFSSYINAETKEISAPTSHFSLFGLFAYTYSGVTNIQVYPVPWVPNDGNTDNGKPYMSGDNLSGIIFDNLTQSVKIEIYTITGELVWSKSTDTSGGKVQWDGKNNSGRDTASGGYFALITDKATGAKVVKKIAIVR